jgi:hypothetical protein
MQSALRFPMTPDANWRDLIWPKEHGSWSLALEPVALGLLAAPSGAGGALAVAAVAGFFCRRPLRTAVNDARAERRLAARRAAAGCALLALAALSVAIGLGGAGWLRWLLPSAVAGAVFAACDLRQAGREQYAELAGAVAFGWLPAAFVVLAGGSAWAALALGAIMLARAVPTVLTVRSVLRSRKTGERHFVPALVMAVLSVAVVDVLYRRGDAPFVAVAAIAVFALRSAALLVYPRPPWRASRLGMMEAALGIAFVLAVGLAWRM